MNLNGFDGDYIKELVFKEADLYREHILKCKTPCREYVISNNVLWDLQHKLKIIDVLHSVALGNVVFLTKLGVEYLQKRKLIDL